MIDKRDLTGYPSIDKPWTKYYSEEEITLELPNGSVFDDLKKHSYTRGGTALEYMKLKISYEALFKKINDVARALKYLGVQTGEIVSVCLPNIPEAVYSIYAINQIGAVANMLDPRSAPQELEKALVEGNSSILITLDLVTDRFMQVIHHTKVETIISVSAIQSFPSLVRCIFRARDKSLRRPIPKSITTWQRFIQMGRKINHVQPAKFQKNADAMIAYTGGTTGIPKGVIGTNETITSVTEMEKMMYVGTEGDRLLDIAPPWTYYGICNSLHAPLCMGLCVVLVPKLGADELSLIIEKLKPNHVFTVPSALSAIIQEKDTPAHNWHFLKTLLVGADRLDETVEQQVNESLKKYGSDAIVTKGYGMTEVMAGATYTIAGCEQVGSVGIPYPGNIVSAFIDENGTFQECKIGELGEIAITGPTLMKGYFGSAASETGEVKKQHHDGSIWIHTGDLGFVGEDGRIYIEGRMKRMFVKNGYKVFPGNIEKSIMKHPNVSGAAVISVRDGVVGNRIKAFVMLRTSLVSKKAVENDLVEMLTEQLYDYELPDAYIFVDSLPLTGMNKVDYQALEEIARKDRDDSY